jgi:peptidoglycan/LPS O-acetylase OafA/YrhL
MKPPAHSGWNILRLRRITSADHRYLPEVDGLRFLAIFGVLFFHVIYAATHVDGVQLQNSPLDFLLAPFQQGHRGVELFFVISGFILALPFAAQHLKHAPPVSTGRYYLRRLTRLEPPYLVALTGFYIAAVLLHTPDATSPNFLNDFFLRLFYLRNLVRGDSSQLDGVTWTLEIEIQFYLLAPLLAQLFRLPVAARRILFCTLIGVLPWAGRFLPWAHWTCLFFGAFFLMGMLLADFHLSGTGAKWLSASGCDLIGLASLLALMFLPDKNFFFLAFPWLIALLFLAALRGGWFKKMLQNSWLTVLGGMCYSLYLIHYPLLSFTAAHLVRSGETVLHACLRVGLCGLPFVLLTGIIFYAVLERPCMNPRWPQEWLARFRRQ